MAKPTYERKAILPLAQGFNLIASGVRSTKLWGETISITNFRTLALLKNGVKCAHCRTEATHWAVERHAKGNPGCRVWHLNAYKNHRDGNSTMLTCDHILAKCLGGENTFTNTQTLCHLHNHMKAIRESKLFDALKTMGLLPS